MSGDHATAIARFLIESWVISIGRGDVRAVIRRKWPTVRTEEIERGVSIAREIFRGDDMEHERAVQAELARLGAPRGGRCA